MQGTLTGIGLRIVGVSDPAFWGLLATFAAVIPVVGTALVWGRFPSCCGSRFRPAQPSVS